MSEETKFNFDPEQLIDRNAIAALLKQNLEKQIVDSVQWEVSALVKKHAVEILDSELKEIVETQKAEILKQVKEHLPSIAQALAQKMMAKAIENMNSYQGREILKKLFD